MFEKANIDKILQMYRSSMLIILVLILVFSHSILITQERFYIFYTLSKPILFLVFYQINIL